MLQLQRQFPSERFWPSAHADSGTLHSTCVCRRQEVSSDTSCFYKLLLLSDIIVNISKLCVCLFLKYRLNNLTQFWQNGLFLYQASFTAVTTTLRRSFSHIVQTGQSMLLIYLPSSLLMTRRGIFVSAMTLILQMKFLSWVVTANCSKSFKSEIRIHVVPYTKHLHMVQ